jgi:DNA-binding GntR family transcriptional regulator
MEYPPGMPISEKDLCEEFKVSRTPLREAIRKLEDMELVTVIPRYGTYVSPIDINEIRCAFEVKIKLEGLAGALAARRITRDKLEELRKLIEKADRLSNEETHHSFIEVDAMFHDIIREATQNAILQEILGNLHSRCARLWNSTLNQIIPVSEIIDQLKKIYFALEERETEKARNLLENHVQYFIDKIKSQLL